MLAGDVDLKTWYKPEVNKKILKELSKRSDLKGIIDVSLFIIAILVSGYLLFIGIWIHSLMNVIQNCQI